MKKGKIIRRFAGAVSSISGIILIILSMFNMSLNSTWLGYGGGIVLIVFGGYLWLWELSHTPKTWKK